MKHVSTAKLRSHFKPLIQSNSVQAAIMVLKPGQSSSEKVENEHPDSEQWLYVVSGEGRAKVGGKSVPLDAGSLVLIEKGEPHQVTNTGDEAMVTLNFYSPPAYTAAGNLK